MRVFVIGGTTVHSTNPGYRAEQETLEKLCCEIGRCLARANQHVAVLCSPFGDSADYQVLRGLAEASSTTTTVEMHFPDSPEVRARLETVAHGLALASVVPRTYYPPQSDTPEARQYAWLLCQLAALDSSHVVIAVGGRLDGAANLLLWLAEGRQKPVLPIPLLGGAAGQAFHRRRYELEDKLGAGPLEAIHDRRRAGEMLALAERLADSGPRQPLSTGRRPRPSRFFVSYARARPAEADYVETLLRRRNHQVFRDDHDFDAGHEVPGQIREAIYAATVFIVLWCKEYACSPWCADEFQIALERHREGSLILWIIRTDETRIVPPAARPLLHYPGGSRAELEGSLHTLLLKLDLPA
jgi:hypothetical protein